MLPRSVKRAGLAIAFTLAGVATASAFPGGGVGVGAGGFAGSGVSPGSVSLSGSAVPGLSPANGLAPLFAMPQRFRDLNVVGKVGIKPTSLPPNATVVRLRLDGQEIPMRLDTELQTAELQFDPNAGYARDLYRSILTKRIEIVGQQSLRDQIAQAAAESKPLQVEGYVFDRTSPYFVVKSVKAE